MRPPAERRYGPEAGPARALTRDTLAVLSIGALIVVTIWIVRPFLSAFLWATTIVISTWPLLTGLQRRLWQRRGLATAVMTLGLLLVLLIPLGWSIGTLVANLDEIVAWVQSLKNVSLPAPPGWVERIPAVGSEVSAAWKRLASEETAASSARVLPYAGRFVQWLLAQVGGIGTLILHFLLTVIISAVLYAKGESAARGVRLFCYRLAGRNGERAAILAAQCVRGVALGVAGTAMVQTIIAGMGFAIAGVPGAVLLTAAVLILCLAQIGPLLVMLPAVIWKFSTGDTLRGCILLAFMLVAGTIDNILRPMLIRKGADLPLVLIFAGVIGGMMALGVTGIFVGPVILAVTYILLDEWVNERAEPGENAASKAAASRA